MAAPTGVSQGANEQFDKLQGSDILVRLVGPKATVLHGDPCVFDRWRWLRRHLKAGALRTLDAGCGSGAFSFYSATIGNECLGISFSAPGVENARRRAVLLGLSNAKFRLGDLRDLAAFGLAPFDQIICAETIEHIRDDRKLVADFAALLKPSGRLLLTTPFAHYKPMVGDMVHEREEGGHVRAGYTHQELRALLDSCGMDTAYEGFISGVVSQQLTNLMRIVARVDNRLAWATTFPLRALQVLDRPLTLLTRYPYLSVAIVGIKRPMWKANEG